MNQKEKMDLVRRILELGYQVEPEVLDMLCSTRTSNEVLALLVRIARNKNLLNVDDHSITMNDISFLVAKNDTTSVEETIDDRSRLVLDSSSLINTTDNPFGHLHYFQNRFDQMASLMKSRLDWKNVVPINSINRLLRKNKKQIKLAGFVLEKRLSKVQSSLMLEDNTGVVQILSSASSHSRWNEVLLDEFIIVDIVPSERGFVANSINHIDIPSVPGHRADRDVYVGLISDLRVGSGDFDHNSWVNFVNWLKGNFGERDIALKVKYLILGGDLINSKLTVAEGESSIIEKYKLLSDMLSDIPAYIHLFIIPGEQDATRLALPQPAILRNFARQLYNMSNVTMLGNPSFLSLDGVTVLVFHGQSLQDVSDQITADNIQVSPSTLMKALLKARHLAPSYGLGTLIASDQNDGLVINIVPDVFFCSHLGGREVDTYKGVLMVNCPNWSINSSSVSGGRIAIVNLRTFEVVWR